MILEGHFGLLVALMGVVCSSWSIVNRGTSCRDVLTPLGQVAYLSVRCANKMVSRTWVWRKEFVLFSTTVRANLIALLVWDVNSWHPWEDSFVGRFGGLLGSYVYIRTTGKLSHHPPSSFVVGIQGASEEG